MAENIDVAQAEARPAEGSVLDHLLMRDEEGQLRHEFVEEITRAIRAADRPLLCEVVAASTARTREVPSASLRLHSAA